jgi:hypothetical protein
LGLSGGYLDALKQGNWMFIYMTTVETPDVLVEGKHLAAMVSTSSAASTGKVLVMGKESTMGFMSIFGDAYEAGRAFADSELQSPPESETMQKKQKPEPAVTQ